MAIIKTEGLTKFYGKDRGIEKLDLRVSEGEVFGFIGPNGAGKSTTIRTILGFIKPTSGNAEVLGQSVSGNLTQVKKKIGYLPSEVVYYDDMTAGQLLRYSAKYYDGDFSERIKSLSDYFELDLKRKIEDLSYGNRKKVGIVQALLHGPKLLILDEPTGGLDPLMQNKFFELLEAERDKGTTIFFSSHVLSEVQRLCDRVGIIKDGSMIKVEALTDMQKVQYKKVKATFASRPAHEMFADKQIESLEIKNHTMTCLYSGHIKPLMATLVKMDLKNIWVEDPNLEEIFMHHYQ